MHSQGGMLWDLCRYSDGRGDLKLRMSATSQWPRTNHKSTGTIFFAPRCLSDFHHGTVHKPVAVKKDALTLPNARAAVATEWDMWKNLRAYDVRSSATSEEGREICSFSIRHEPLPSETLRACSNIPKHTRRESCAKGHGCRAAFAVQGASASQLAAARLTDTLARHPGMAVEANDAVSACKQVHVSEARRLLRLPEKECPHEWMGLRPSRGPKMSDSIEESVVLLEQNLCGHPLAGMLWGRKLRREMLQQHREQVSPWNDFTSTDIHNCACPKMWTTRRCVERTCRTYVEKICKKEVDLKDPTPFPNQVGFAPTEKADVGHHVDE